MTTEILSDWRGNEIYPGATIVYAVTQSSSITMVEAVVDEIFYTNEYRSVLDPETQKWDYKEVPVPSLKVTRKAEHHKGSYRLSTFKGKKVTLTALERVTVIPEQLVAIA